MIAYHFVSKTLRDGKPIPANGEWLTVEGDLKMCERGLHGSVHPFDALQYAPGETLCLVELAGEILHGDDKVCARKRKIIARFDATDLLRDQARKSALSVIHLWDAPAVVREYLETGDETKRDAALDAADAARDTAWDAARATAMATASAAADAAWAAAMAAARAAAMAAAWDTARAATYAAMDAASATAWDAAMAAAKQRFLEAVEAKFKEIT